MVALRREEGIEYRCDTVMVPLSEVARRERRLPEEFRDDFAADITPAYLRYARPLVGDVPAHARLVR
jgi:6-phosphofructokinase 1